MSAPVLVFEGVHFAYAAHGPDVLDGLDLETPSGSIMALLGPNGAGKTTLLHLALGWLKPQRGRITLSGRPLPAYTRRELGQAIGLVPQSEHVPFDYSVLEYVLFGRTPYLSALEMPGPADLEIARQALQRVGLAHLAGRSITNLSGGERQLALAGRALAQQPRLLLLDEPTSHLDIGNKGRLIQLMRQLAAEGVTVLFTTHEPDVAAAVADRLILFRSGRVLVAGPLDEVMTSQNLTACYQTPIQVVQVGRHRLALWN